MVFHLCKSKNVSQNRNSNKRRDYTYDTMPSLSPDTIEINRNKKEIHIINNIPLYKAIKSGAVLSMIPYTVVIESLRSAAKSIDSTLTWSIDILTQILKGAYYYHALKWNIRASRHLQVDGSASTTFAANLVLDHSAE